MDPDLARAKAEDLQEVDTIEESKQIEQTEVPEEGIELGDRILLLGGRYNRTRGRVYYIDDDIIRILPDGVSDRLIDIELLNGELPDDLGIEEIVILSKRLVTTFVGFTDLQVGQNAETFGPKGEPGIKYSVVAIDEKEDTATLQDESGAERTFEFKFRGIDRSEPFAVIRALEPVKPVEETTETEVQEEAFEILDEFEVPAFEEIQEIPTIHRVYPDVVQKTDMLNDLIKGLDTVQQKNMKKIQTLRKIVETMTLLRNDIITYNTAGKVTGTKEVSFETLSELLDKTEFPLAKPVLKLIKTFYLDHSNDHIESIRAGQEAIEMPHLLNSQAEVSYLEDVIKHGERYLDEQMKVNSKVEGNAKQLPRWYLVWQGFFNDYMKDIKGDGKQISFDREIFRSELPSDDLRVSGISNVGDAKEIVDLNSIKPLKYATARALGPRFNTSRMIESGDEGDILAYVLFPLVYARDLGVIRSGMLAQDSAAGQTAPKTMDMIIEEGGPVSDIPSSDGILAVNADGSSLGNVEIQDWLKGQALYGNGIGDLLPLLRSFGLSSLELTVDQKEVLIKKLDSYRSAVKKHIVDMRSAIIEPDLVKNQSFLETDREEILFTTLIGEPILKDALSDFAHRYPSYSKHDISRFLALYLQYSDYVLSTLGGVAQGVAIERTRAVRDQFLKALEDALALQRKMDSAGEAPLPNKCPHVESLDGIRKVKDNDDRVKLLIKFMNQFRGEKKDHWIWCSVCKEHLLCEHEFLMIQEFLHPREKEILHKELLLTFSAGEFQGKYMCGTCGQTISSIEYDTSLEYDDEGKPMMGRAVLVDQDALDEEDLEKVFAVEDEADEKITFKSEHENVIYRVIAQLASLLGVNPDRRSYEKMVNRASVAIRAKPTKEHYAQMLKSAKAEGRKAVDHDVFLSRQLVSLSGAALLIDVQGHVPTYTIRYTLQGCAKPEFTGYPIGQEEDKTGVEYISCAIASIFKREAPWEQTGFQTIRSDKDRLATVKKFVDSSVRELFLLEDVKQDFVSKKQYLLETIGSDATGEIPKDSIPDGFTPVQHILSETPEKIIIPDSASPAMKAQAWILEGHKLARENGIYTRGNPYSEASCCYSSLAVPGEFWKQKQLPALTPKVPPRGPRGSVLQVHMSPRKTESLFGKADASVMFRLFMRVCFTGKRVGLPHEPGYTNKCPWCNLEFPEDPRLPPPEPRFSKDGGLQKKYDEEYKIAIEERGMKEVAALQAQGVEVTKESFETLLDATHSQFLIPPLTKKKIPIQMEMLQSLLQLDPPPFEDYVSILQETIASVSSLAPGATDAEKAIAYGPLSEKALAFEEGLQQRIGKAHESIKSLLTLSPQTLGETLRSYFLIPFQRALSETVPIKVQKSYKLSTETVEDIEEILKSHTGYILKMANEVRADKYVKSKINEFVSRLAVVTPLFIRTLRANLLPAGEIGLKYIQQIIIYGIFYEFINPNHIPTKEFGSVVAPARSVTENASMPIKMLGLCLGRLSGEGLNLSGEKIRELIAERYEKEKQNIIKDFDGMDKDTKTVALLSKKLGLGKWAVGGTKKIRQYDPDQYHTEKEDRAAAGIVDTVAEVEEGLDHTQTAEDDA